MSAHIIKRRHARKHKDVDPSNHRSDHLNVWRAHPAIASQRAGVNRPPTVVQGNSDRVSNDARGLFEKWMDSPRCSPSENLINADSTGDPGKLRDEILKRICAT
ncbi:hypothetical protein HOO65_070376 [Ceratocystis lukuohia]|uniref:Uncharacterized protein n=1 Tax=Ceratocystis lukuohia TaxID=2019550 RepID=A0ABR4MCA8_9PEZI